jgi:tetratricopeptide (TPR) repeat protein
MHMGVVHMHLGNHERALDAFERAHRVFVELDRAADQARALQNLSWARSSLGRYAAALADLERSLEIRERLDDRGGMAKTLQALADLAVDLGDPERALRLAGRALEISGPIGDPSLDAQVRGTMAKAQRAAGRREEALATWQELLEGYRARGDARGLGAALGNVATMLDAVGRREEALARFEEAVQLLRGRGERGSAAIATANLGTVLGHLGRPEKGVALLERAVAELEALRMDDATAFALMRLAQQQAAVGDDARAIESVRRALRTLENVFAGLGEVEGATARENFSAAFETGAAAALRLDRPADLVHFLEAARAGTLLDTLGGRDAQRWVRLPDDLAAALGQAKAKARVAQRDHAAAHTSGQRGALRAASEAVEAALQHEADVVARVQRDAKRQAGLLYPRPATEESLRGALAPGDAFVLYGRTRQEMLAVVLEPFATRVVPIGPRDALLDQVDAVPWSDPKAAADERVEALRGALWAPLALGAHVRRVVVSPDPLLVRVPFGALAPGLQVALVPSGRTYERLREEPRRRGQGVLAVADPETGAFGARGLPRLPSARREAEAVADTVLSGAEATEKALRVAIAARPRWRAVHLACHGVFDERRPFMTALALAPAADDDGRLTAADLWSMDVPTDLAVLSACETGRGRELRAEGLIGLTSAFLYAGAPRVVCSLWKVDDEATSALMTRLYELWSPRDGSPGLPTAEALRRAQEHVRAQERWRHPYYWAAWALWGLPD